MKLRHHDFEFEVDDEWWRAAGMEGWIPRTRSYQTDQNGQKSVVEVSIAEIEPVRRNLSHGVFNDDPDNAYRQETGR